MIFPITIWRKPDGANGRNWPFVIMVDPDHPRRAAIWAQEAYESRYKLNPINLVLSLFPKGKRRMEFMGHEIEVQAAGLLYWENMVEYRKAEAKRMHRGYGGLFKEYTPAEIMDQMKSREGKAWEWIGKCEGQLIDIAFEDVT